MKKTSHMLRVPMTLWTQIEAYAEDFTHKSVPAVALDLLFAAVTGTKSGPSAPVTRTTPSKTTKKTIYNNKKKHNDLIIRVYNINTMECKWLYESVPGDFFMEKNFKDMTDYLDLAARRTSAIPLMLPYCARTIIREDELDSVDDLDMIDQSAEQAAYLVKEYEYIKTQVNYKELLNYTAAGATPFLPVLMDQIRNGDNIEHIYIK